MTTHIEVRAPKHGVGCTTIACLLALAHGKLRRTMLVDTWEHGDCAAALGVPSFSNGVELVRGLMLTDNIAIGAGIGEDYELVVWDVGDHVTWEPANTHAQQIWVVRNDYLCLSRWTRRPPARVDSLILVEEAGRALAVRDIESVLGHTVDVVVPFDPAISRSTDAGLLALRPPKAAASPLSVLISQGEDDARIAT